MDRDRFDAIARCLRAAVPRLGALAPVAACFERQPRRGPADASLVSVAPTGR